MSRQGPLSFEVEGFRRWLHGMDRRIKDLERGGDWRFDDEFDPAGGVSLITRNEAHLLSMAAVGDSIAAGGDSITFGAITAQHGFSGTSGPGATWTHPTAGVFVVSVKLQWVGYAGGGTIQIVVDGVALPEGRVVEGSSGSEAFGVVMYRASAGSVGAVRVTHSSPSAQTCDAAVTVALPDPQAIEAPSSDWELTFTADAWGITNDGVSSWFTTQGNDGETVTERGADGTALASFPASAVSAPGEARVRGISYDGADLWLVGADEVVARYSTAGALEFSFDLAASWASERAVVGIAHDGTDVWITGSQTGQLRRYSTAGAHELTVSLGYAAGDLTVYGSTVYVVDRSAQQLRTYTLAGVEGTAVDISDAPINPTGVWIAADGTLYISGDGVGIYRRLTVI